MVAVFIWENEDANSLEEVLEQIKSLNPGWKPRNVFVDFFMAEIVAVEKTMPSKFILISYPFCFRSLPILEHGTITISAQTCAYSTNHVIVIFMYL